MGQKKSSLSTCAKAACALPLLAVSGIAVALPTGYTCVGTSVCGTFAANGVVTESPDGGEYAYVTTAAFAGSPAPGNNGDLGIGSETNSSVARSPVFAAEADEPLQFYFNYITSDGSQYVEYAWTQLINADDPTDVTTLFTARTTTSGDTVPGFGLPPLATGVTLVPASTPIIPGGPTWAPLGGSSGACFGPGCGYTDWIEMTYAVPDAGNYFIEFGVTNWLDTAFQSGFAWDGVEIGGVPIDPEPTIPEPASLALLALGVAGLGAMRRRRK